MSIEGSRSGQQSTVMRLPSALFWLAAVAAGLVCGAVVFFIIGLGGIAFGAAAKTATIAALIGAIGGFFAPILVLRRKRRVAPVMRRVGDRSPVFATASEAPAISRPRVSSFDAPQSTFQSAPLITRPLADDRSDESHAPSDQAKPPNHRQPPASKRFRNLALVAVAAGAIAGLVNYFKAGSDDLGLELKASQDGFLNAISIMNTRAQPIDLSRVIINGRPECNQPSDQDVRVLKTGDKMIVLTRCEVINVTVESKSGTSTYKFR